MAFDVAEICLNGHTITPSADRYPEFRQKFCKDCGEATITHCPKCRSPIQGHYYDAFIEEKVSFIGWKRPPPSFCHECGSGYPWTIRRLKAAKELADEFEELTPEERKNLKKSLNGIFVDSPNTEVAATRFKRIMAKVGKESYSAMKTVITDVVSEVAKKTIFGS